MGPSPLGASDELHLGLRYPWSRSAAPPDADPIEIAKGVHWVRFKLPIALDHINLWLLEDEDGFTLVDTGLNTADARDQWEAIFRGYAAGKPVRRVICTHFHPDHMGLAGWLAQRFDCDLWTSRAEYLTSRTMAADAGRQAPETDLRFFAAAGYDAVALEDYRSNFGRFRQLLGPVPDSYRRLRGGDTLRIGGRAWHAIDGGGHSPEHICLYCPELQLLISGDQVLPGISSNVSVYPSEPHADPLAAFLAACARLRADLPADLLVLPSHGAPFIGLHERLTALIDKHQLHLGLLLEHLHEPRRAVDCFSVLFKRAIDLNSYGLATGEALAHLSLLVGSGDVVRQRDSDGVDWYRRVGNAPMSLG